MEPIIGRLLFENWQRKLIAVFVALVVWVFVNQSITETKTIPNIPVRVMNIPQDKTINGLLPNGYLSNRLTLTISGSKDVVDRVEQGDLEVRIDATNADSDDWVVQLTKKNIVSLDPSIDIVHHINTVSHSEFIIKLSKLVTEKVPIYVKPPIGKAPQGYEILDIWPQKLTQTLSGPEEEIDRLKIKGLKLIFDLDQITKEELDALKRTNLNAHDDEVSYIVPKRWKKVLIPFRKYAPEEINDPEANHLRIDFLRKRLIPLENPIPVKVFFPEKTSKTINPLTTTIAVGEDISIKNGIKYFTPPAYVRGVSRLFLDVIHDNMVIMVIAAPKSERETLQWSLEVIDPQEMEDTYVAYLIKDLKGSQKIPDPEERENVLRLRFREYMQKLSLHDANGEKLRLKCTLEGSQIIIRGFN